MVFVIQYSFYCIEHIDPLGRKRAMFFVNIPFIIAWFVMFNASSTVQIFIGTILLGLSIGLTESPIITYVGEIWQVNFFYTFGK